MIKKLRYLSGFSALTISEGLYDMAFVIMAYRISGQASTAAIAYALGYAAEIIVSLAIGGFLDTFSRRKLFNYTIALKSAIFIFIIGYSRNAALSASAIWAFAFLADLLHHISRTANTVSLFQIFSDKDKASMQGAVIAISGFLRIIGPVLAGSLVGIFNDPALLLILCLVLQAFCAWSFRHILPAEPARESEGSSPSFKENILSSTMALREALSSVKWRWFFLADALATLFIGTLTLMLYPLLRQVHNISESQTGFFLGLAAVGTIAAGLLFSKIIDSINTIDAAKWGLFTACVCAVILSIQGNHLILSIGLIGFQCGSTLFFRSMGMYLQAEVPQDFLGSWWTASDAFGRLFGLIGILLGGYLFDYVGGTMFCLGLGASLLISSSAFFLKPIEAESTAT